MTEELTLVHTEEEAEITHVKALCVVLSRQRSKVPGLKPVAAKLYRLYSFQLSLLNKFRDFLL